MSATCRIIINRVSIVKISSTEKVTFGVNMKLLFAFALPPEMLNVRKSLKKSPILCYQYGGKTSKQKYYDYIFVFQNCQGFIEGITQK